MKLYKRLSVALAVVTLGTSFTAFANTTPDTTTAPIVALTEEEAESTTPSIYDYLDFDYKDCIPNVSAISKDNHELRHVVYGGIIVDAEGIIYAMNATNETSDRKFIDADKAIYSPNTGEMLVDKDGYIVAKTYELYDNTIRLKDSEDNGVVIGISNDKPFIQTENYTGTKLELNEGKVYYYDSGNTYSPYLFYSSDSGFRSEDYLVYRVESGYDETELPEQLDLPSIKNCIPNLSLLPSNTEIRKQDEKSLIIVDTSKNIYSLDSKLVIDKDGNIYGEQGNILIDKEGNILNPDKSILIDKDGNIQNGVIRFGVTFQGEERYVISTPHATERHYLVVPIGKSYFSLGEHINGSRSLGSYSANSISCGYGAFLYYDESTGQTQYLGMPAQTGNYVPYFSTTATEISFNSDYVYKNNLSYDTDDEDEVIDNDNSSNDSSDSISGGSGSSDNTTETTTEATTETPTTENTETTEAPETVIDEARQEDLAKVESLQEEVSFATQTVIQEQEPVLTHNAVATDLGLTLNGKTVELQDKVLSENGRTMLPVRTITELLNLEIGYNAASKVAIVVKDGKTIEFVLGTNTAIINGTEIVQIDPENPDVKIIAENGRTYLPIRFLAEQFGLTVDYSNDMINLLSK